MAFSAFSRACRPFRRFRQCNHGGVTVEAAIWLPFWIFFLFGIGEVALLFNGQAVALNTTQSVLRSYTVGDITSEAEVKERLTAALANISEEVTVTFFMADGVATAGVTVPARDLTGGFGIFSALTRFDVTVITQQTREV